MLPKNICGKIRPRTTKGMFINMKELKNGIYYVGALNPNLRVFDIIMRTDYGTSYNAYIVKGGEKTALIETCHNSFSKVFFDNINEVCKPQDIDYVICNHTEPDHSGSLVKLIEIKPEITVVGTNAAIKNLKSITNTEFNAMTVKAGDSIDLGGRTLKFIPNPNVHWPDTMFTYLEEDKTLFSCDFLGSHYCEPTFTDEWLSHPDAYADAFHYYYCAIMGPFKPFVLEGLKKLDGLEIDMVCPSHGPVLINGIKTAMDKYREWSTPAEKSGKTACIAYVSAYGYTRAMAEAAKGALEGAGYNVECFDIIKHDMAKVAQSAHDCDLLLLGSPTINRDAVKPVWDLISNIDPVSCKNKPVYVFGSYGWSGEAQKNLSERCAGIGLKVLGSSRVCFKPTDADLKEFTDAVIAAIG